MEGPEAAAPVEPNREPSRQLEMDALLSYILLYGVSRFVIEFYRGDSRGVLFGTLSTSQSLSVILVPVAMVMLYLLGRRTRPAPREAVQARAA